MGGAIAAGACAVALAVGLVACPAPAPVTPTSTPSHHTPAPSADPGTPATTWRDRSDVRDAINSLEQPFATPADLLDELAAFLVGRTGARTVRIEIGETAGDRASGGVVLTNVPDDSILGEQYRVSMRRTGSGWSIESLEARTLCRRGVSSDSRLCV